MEYVQGAACTTFILDLSSGVSARTAAHKFVAMSEHSVGVALPIYRFAQTQHPAHMHQSYCDAKHAEGKNEALL